MLCTDPRFAGAGPAHAPDVARLLGVDEVVIPPASGAALALGFLAAPLSFERDLLRPLLPDVATAAAIMEGQAYDAARNRAPALPTAAAAATACEAAAPRNVSLAGG